MEDLSLLGCYDLQTGKIHTDISVLARSSMSKMEAIHSSEMLVTI